MVTSLIVTTYSVSIFPISNIFRSQEESGIGAGRHGYSGGSASIILLFKREKLDGVLRFHARLPRFLRIWRYNGLATTLPKRDF